MAKKSIKVKPGKTQSKFGFMVGIVFVMIGLFVVIPTFGLFGVFWTAMAVFICFANYKNGFTDNGMASHEIIIEDSGNSEILSGDGFKNGVLNSSSGREYVVQEADSLSERTYFQEAREADEADIEKKLIKLSSLYEQKLITKEEYDEKRKQLLNEF